MTFLVFTLDRMYWKVWPALSAGAPCTSDITWQRTTRPISGTGVLVREIYHLVEYPWRSTPGWRTRGDEEAKKRKRIERRFRARALLYSVLPRRRVRFVLSSRVSRHEQGVWTLRDPFPCDLSIRETITRLDPAEIRFLSVGPPVIQLSQRSFYPALYFCGITRTLNRNSCNRIHKVRHLTSPWKKFLSLRRKASRVDRVIVTSPRLFSFFFFF